VAAIVTCLALVFATFGHMQRDAVEAASAAPPAAKCDQAKKGHLQCLILLGDRPTNAR
jgi:hypothetical protein